MSTPQPSVSDARSHLPRPFSITLLAIFHGLMIALLLLAIIVLMVQQWNQTGRISFTTQPLTPLFGLFMGSVALLAQIGYALWKLQRRMYPVVVAFYSLAAFAQLIALLAQQRWIVVSFVLCSLITVYLLLPRTRALFTQ
jgi:hypothetical protein